MYLILAVFLELANVNLAARHRKLNSHTWMDILIAELLYYSFGARSLSCLYSSFLRTVTRPWPQPHRTVQRESRQHRPWQIHRVQQ